MFSPILNLRFFFTKFYGSILEGCKVSFSVIINSYIDIFDLNRKLLPNAEKQNKENFVKKNRRFRNRENMWWAWPKSDSVVVIADATPTSSQRILISSSCYSWLHLEEKKKWRKINKSLDYMYSFYLL